MNYRVVPFEKGTRLNKIKYFGLLSYNTEILNLKTKV